MPEPKGASRRAVFDVWQPFAFLRAAGPDLNGGRRAELVTADRLPCRHRGQVVGYRARGRGCGTCLERVYNCDLYGLASIRSVGGQVAICIGCPDLAAPEPNGGSRRA